jgi:hypothetical protein
MLAQFDVLGWAVLLGSILFLAGLVWLLVDNRSFEAFNTPRTTIEDRGTMPRADEGSSNIQDPVVGRPAARDDDEPGPRRRPGRAA